MTIGRNGEKRDQYSNVINEIIQTENDFLNDMKVLDSYLAKFIHLPAIAEQDRKLLAEFRRVLLQLIKQDIEVDSSKLDQITKYLGSPKQVSKPEGKFYKVYYRSTLLPSLLQLKDTADKNTQVECLSKEITNATAFYQAATLILRLTAIINDKQLLNRLQQNPDKTLIRHLNQLKADTKATSGGGLDFDAMLIKPMQRILKYPLFLEQLLRCVNDEQLQVGLLTAQTVLKSELARANAQQNDIDFHREARTKIFTCAASMYSHSQRTIDELNRALLIKDESMSMEGTYDPSITKLWEKISKICENNKLSIIGKMENIYRFLAEQKNVTEYVQNVRNDFYGKYEFYQKISKQFLEFLQPSESFLLIDVVNPDSIKTICETFETDLTALPDDAAKIRALREFINRLRSEQKILELRIDKRVFSDYYDELNANLTQKIGYYESAKTKLELAGLKVDGLTKLSMLGNTPPPLPPLNIPRSPQSRNGNADGNSGTNTPSVSRLGSRN